MKQRYALAVALALAVSGMAIGLAGGPVAAQDDRAENNPGPGVAPSSSSDCPASEDFVIAEKHGNANSRQLDANTEEIGLADVDAGTPEELRVHMETSGALDVEVFHVNATTDECEEFDGVNCDKTVTQTGHRTICTLDDPSSGSKDYWAHFTNAGVSPLTYHTWTPDA